MIKVINKCEVCEHTIVCGMKDKYNDDIESIIKLTNRVANIEVTCEHFSSRRLTRGNEVLDFSVDGIVYD